MDDDDRIAAASAEAYELGYRLLIDEVPTPSAYARPVCSSVCSSAGGRLVARAGSAADAAEAGAHTLRRVLVDGDPWPA